MSRSSSKAPPGPFTAAPEALREPAAAIAAQLHRTPEADETQNGQEEGGCRAEQPGQKEKRAETSATAFDYDGATEMSAGRALPPSDATPLLGTTLDGKYRLDAILGEGAMGTVFRGEHLGLGVQIAVKVMKPAVALEPDYVRRFRREAQAMSALNHRNVARVLDFGRSGVFYIVMEFLDAGSLGDWLELLTGPPPLATVEHLMLQLCDALAVAHARGIVHRDLKPDNILLTKEDSGEFLLKVTDFGLAHVEGVAEGEATLTRDGTVAGTPDFMSPEQCRSLSVGPSTDLYAMGCVLTCLLQLEPPFSSGSAMELMSAQMFATPPALERPPGAEIVPMLLERLRLSLLAKHQHQRPPDAAAVRAALVEAMNPEANAARLPPRKELIADGDREGRMIAHTSVRPEIASFPGSESLCVASLVQNEGSLAVDQALMTGMASHAISLKPVASVKDSGDAHVLILDCGGQVEAALEWLAAGKGIALGAPRLVCAKAPSAAAVKLLIEAGAADVMRYPIDAESLGRRVSRLRRRARQRRSK